MQELKKVSAVLIILYMMNGPFFLLHIIRLNMGINLNLPIPFLFLALPAFILVVSAALKKSLRLPYFIHFLLLEVLFLLLESQFLRGGDYAPVYQYPYQFFIFYTLFISLLNFGTDSASLSKLLKYYLGISFGIIFIVFLGYAGLIDYYVERSIVEPVAFRPLGGGLHTNGLSMICAVSIMILTLNKHFDRGILPIQAWKENLLVLFFFIMIMYNSSRGVFLITGVFLFFFVHKDWHRMRLYSKLAVLTFSLAAVGYFVAITLYENLLIIQRFQDLTQWVSRTRQIIVTWENFVDNPFFGVGFHEAARNVIAGYTRSNFHYTQIMASNGIFYFGLYLWFLVKIFGFNLKNPFGLMCISIGFGSLMFYNWSLIFSLSLVAYLNYVYRRPYPQTLSSYGFPKTIHHR